VKTKQVKPGSNLAGTTKENNGSKSEVLQLVMMTDVVSCKYYTILFTLFSNNSIFFSYGGYAFTFLPGAFTVLI
jgi:hypothetical protein